MNYAPFVRIIMRYIIGAAFLGSEQIGDKLAADPDLVAVGALAMAAVVEGAYAMARKRGGAT